MNIALAIVMCSYIYEECMAPHIFPERYASHYECMIAGYEKSIIKMKEIGKQKINKEEIFFKFACYEKEPNKGI